MGRSLLVLDTMFVSGATARFRQSHSRLEYLYSVPDSRALGLVTGEGNEIAYSI